VSKSDSAVDEDTSVTPTLAAQVVAELNLMHQLRESTNERLLGAEEALDAYGKAEEQRAANETARVEAETQRQEAEEQRNKTIGDIHTALDSIIEMQESLIEGGVTVNATIPPATENDEGKILSVEGGEYALKEIEDSSVKSFVDEYISSALGGDY
jgi:hypothetical protein